MPHNRPTSKKYSSWLMVMVLLLLSSCSKDPANVPSVMGYYVESTSTETYQPTEFIAAVNNSEFLRQQLGGDYLMSNIVSRGGRAALLTRQYRLDTIFSNEADYVYALGLWAVETHSFTYSTLSVTGQPIVLSARVTFPKAKSGRAHKLNSLSVYAHYYYNNEDIAPSRDLSPLTLRTLFNSAVIEPDFQGHGNTSEQVFSDISYKAMGRQMLDCALAAIELMERHGVTLAENGYTSLWGCSVAAPIVAGAIHYHDQQLPASLKKALHLKSAFAGGGPMFLDRLLQYIDTHNDYSAASMDLVSLHTLPADYFEGYSFKDFYPSWAQTYKINIDGQTMTYLDAIMHDYSDGYGNLRPVFSPNNVLSNLFAEDMFTASGRLDYTNPKTQILARIMRELTDWSGWQPSIDMYLFHSRKDEYIPYSVSYTFYQEMRDSGKVHWKDMPSVALVDGSYHYTSVMAAILLMILNEEPSTAFGRM